MGDRPRWFTVRPIAQAASAVPSTWPVRESPATESDPEGSRASSDAPAMPTVTPSAPTIWMPTSDLTVRRCRSSRGG